MLRDLGELQIRAVDYVGLTAAFGWTHRVTVTGVAHAGILCT